MEFFQEKASINNLVDEAVKLVENEAYRANMRDELRNCRNLLGGSGSSRRAAEAVLDFIRQRTPEGFPHVQGYAHQPATP